MLKPLSSSQRDTLKQAASTFREALRAGGEPARAAAQYLRERGIDPDSEASAALGLGVVVPDYPGFERFAGRLSIPNLCVKNSVVGIKFRALDDETQPKYDQPDGQVGRLFNLRAMRNVRDWVAITEGEIDAISLEILGLPAVGVPGANGWKPHHYRLFEGLRRVVLVRDDDKGGDPLVSSLVSTPLDVAIVRPVPGFKDVNAALAAGEGEAMKKIVLEAAA